MTAATLNLPIQPSLGFAYIVPYGQNAQFQLGYKGLIQLAIRSGQVKNINSGVIYKSQFKSYDPIFETLEIDTEATPSGEVHGYFASLELVNGFRKMIYWSYDKVYAHGKRFSKSFTSGPWKSDFDAMAQKTLLKDLIGKYAPLSTEMQTAFEEDGKNEDVKTKPIDVTPQQAETLDSFLEAPNKPVESENALEAQTTVETKTEAKTGQKKANKGQLDSSATESSKFPDFDPETGEILEELSFFEGDTTTVKE
jgi:recombination protein RecT